MTREPATLVVPAPAKLNLFLHVTGRRGDGYHTLESLFTLVDWSDRVTLSTRDDGAIVRARPTPGVGEHEDLALRAARALKSAAGVAQGATIAVEKSIPMGAGMGGGSSDAATVLLALNRLWRLDLPRASLAAIGAGLGADVPFFIGGEPAVARGIGERLTPVTLPPRWCAIVVPPVHVATAAIFAAPNLTRATPSAKMDVFSEGYGHNDLEPVATAAFPDIARVIAALKEASPAARMTGSGGAAFATFATEREASMALRSVPANCATRLARTLSRHPLHGFAQGG